MAEIEALLGKANPRLPWGLAGETGQQRRVLEDTYQYLKTLQGNASGPSSWDGIDPATGEIVPGDVGSPGFEGNAEASSQQILQALLQEMQYLRSQTLQPLRTEVMALQQQREQLLNEVRQLEQQRLQGTAQPVAQALPPSLVDELVERLREALLHQLRPQIQSPQGSAQHPAALYGNAEFPALEDGSDLPQLHPQQRLDQLRHIQAQTDYLLLKLDTNLRAVFESMEQSIQSYRDSLHQGLDTMHGLGQQGEVIFKTLVNHLAQQLGQEQATYLDAAATAIPSQSHLVANATTANVLESTESALADLEDWDDIETSSFAAQTDAAAEVEFPEDLPFSIDLDDLDLGEPLAEDEDITLFQLDEAITKLQLDDNDDAIQGNEETLVQREPLPWPGIPDTAHADPEGGSDPVEAEDGVAVHTELDALYESLFGEPDASPNPSDNADIDPESLLPESPLDQALFETHTDLDFALEVEPATAESLDDLASSEPVLEDPVSSFEDAEATHFDTINQDSSLEAEGNLAIADLDFEAFDQALELFERPAEIEAPASDLNAAPTLSDLLGSDESPDPQPTNAGEASLETHTIASLAELLPAASEAATPLFEGLSPDLEMDEDSFIPAPSDEDLLSNPPGATPWDPELKLTADALDQLSVDLLNLEDGSANPPIEAAETVEPVPSVETQSSSSEPLTAEATEVAATEVEPPAPLREHAGSFESDQVDSAAYLDREVAAVAPDENWDDFNLDTLIPDQSPPADHPLDADLNLAPDDLSLQDLSLDLDWIEPEAPAPTDENDPGISDDTDEPLGDDLSGDLGDQSVENDWTLEALPIFEAPPAIVDSANAATENPENAADLDENISDLLAAWTADPARDEPSLDPRDADATTENPETAADQDISDLLAAWTADPDRPSADAPRNEPSLDPRDADATTENPENSADQDISDLLAAWTADPDRPSTDESRDERQSTSLGGFADEVLSEPMGTEPANPELPWLGEEGFSLSLEDISFDLDLPSLAKNYIGGEAVSPATPDQPAPDQQTP